MGSSPSSPLTPHQEPPPPPAQTHHTRFGSVSEQQDLETEVAPPGPPLSEDDAAAAETLASAVHGGRRSHRSKVGMDLYLRKVCLHGGKKNLKMLIFVVSLEYGVNIWTTMLLHYQCIWLKRSHLYLQCES